MTYSAGLPDRADMMSERAAISEFMEMMQNGPLLSEAETNRLIAIAQQPERSRVREDAFQMLIGRNIRLVSWTAAKYLCRGVPALDLMQAGCEGMVTAIERFDPSQAKFSTFATWWVRQGMQRAIRQKSVMHIPAHIQDQLFLIRRTAAVFHREYGRMPSNLELLAEIKTLPETKIAQQITLREIIDVRPLGDRRLISYDAVLSDEDETTMQAFIGVEDTTELQVDLAALRDRFDLVMDKLHGLMVRRLNAPQRIVLLARLGWDGKSIPILEELAKTLGVTRERVRQIENRAWMLLCLPLSKEHLAFLVRIWHNLKEWRSA